MTRFARPLPTARHLTVELPEELVVGAESEAVRSSRPLREVVQEALVEYLGWRAVERARSANTDLDEAETLRSAYAELREVRAQRTG